DAEALCEREKAAREAFQPGFVRRGERQRERGPAWRGAHSRHIREIDRQRLVAELARIRAGAEMRAFEQQVGGNREFHSRTRPQQRRVVADAERDAARAPVNGPHLARCAFVVLADQFKFRRQASRRGRSLSSSYIACRTRAISSARSSTASFSSTPLTNLWPSVPPKLLPSSIASLSTTLNGVSGRSASSQAPIISTTRSTGESEASERSRCGVMRASSPSRPATTPRISASAKAWSQRSQ